MALGALSVGTHPAGAAPPGTQTLVGALHEHSAYSDGWPGTRPRDYYESGARYHLDFMGGSDHSDNLGIPAVFSEACYGQGRGGSGQVLLPQCVLADQVHPADSFRKWEATAEQAQQTMTAHPRFSAFRGFEWSSDRYGHISVYFSRNYTSAYTDGGFVDMNTFWRWFTTSPSLGGGADGIATFNHPGAKKIDFTSDLSAPGLNWNDFAYVPAADSRMVGIEVFNDTDEYGSGGGPYPEGSYAHALDKGWHVGASAAEDLGHRKPPLDNWGGPQWAKTVVISHGRTPADIHAALLARHFYAIGPKEGKLRLSFTVDRQPMGERLTRRLGKRLPIQAATSDHSLRLEALTSHGRIVATSTGKLRTFRRTTPKEKWYFVRARRGKTIVAYSSPVWVSAVAGSPTPATRHRAPQLRGVPRHCAGHPFDVALAGRGLARVAFYIDRRRAGPVRRLHSGRLYTVRVDPHRLRSGSHRLSVHFAFSHPGTAPSRNITRRFSVCRRDRDVDNDD